MDKIAFVCQRYGSEVNGGSEAYCMQVAERLSVLYDVTVYTTCALDYTTWSDHYLPGEEMINGVRVKRWRVKKERNQERFERISQRVINNPEHNKLDEQKWIDEQGPCCPELLKVLRKEHKAYRVVFFMTYLYYLAAKGMPLGFDNAVLIPTAHDEPPIYLRQYDKVFSAAKGLIWLTPEERIFARKRFPQIQSSTPEEITGIGMDISAEQKAVSAKLPEGIQAGKYLVYAGRIDENKGCKEMFETYRRYKVKRGGNLKLVLMGKAVIPVPEDGDLLYLGFVSDEVKLAVMQKAWALVLFSRYESLSMVLLESMLMGTPVLVTGKSEVLKGHCIRSGAGLYFNNDEEFFTCIQWLQEHPGVYRKMQENGRRYVRNNYSWETIIQKYRSMIDQFVVKDGNGR